MLRHRAVRALLLEEVAGVRVPDPEPSASDGEGSAPTPEERERQQAELEADRLDELERAEKKALFMVILDWAAITVLFLFSDPSLGFLTLGREVETVFTVGILAVAVHSGLRFGDRNRYRAVRRALERLS